MPHGIGTFICFWGLMGQVGKRVFEEVSGGMISAASKVAIDAALVFGASVLLL